MANKYPVRPRFEQGRLASAVPILLDEDGFQTVTRKRKALGNLTDAFVNMVAGKTRTGKPRRPSISARLVEKETRQQTIQFSSLPTDFTGVLVTPEQALKSVLEATGETTADISIDVTSSPSP